MRGIAAYQAVVQETTPPDRVVVRVLERAAEFTAMAERAIAGADPAAAHDALIRAQLAVTVLRSALRPDVYPDLAANLDQLYTYLYDRLVRANVLKDPAELADLRRVLDIMADAWREAVVAEGARA